jgi:hypothetical protein
MSPESRFTLFGIMLWLADGWLANDSLTGRTWHLRRHVGLREALHIPDISYGLQSGPMG